MSRTTKQTLEDVLDVLGHVGTNVSAARSKMELLDNAISRLYDRLDAQTKTLDELIKVLRGDDPLEPWSRPWLPDEERDD